MKRMVLEGLKFLHKEIGRQVITVLPGKAKHGGEGLARVLTHAALETCTITAACKDIQYSGRDCPSGDLVLLRIREQDKRIASSGFDRIIGKLVRKAKAYTDLTRRPRVCAIDFTETPFYGDKNSSIWVVGSKKTRGTNWVHRWITLSIVEAGLRITIAAIPVNQLNNDKSKLIRNLLDRAEQLRVNVGCVLLDRGFYSEQVIRTLDSTSLLWLMPQPKNTRSEKAMGTGEETLCSEYAMGAKKSTEYTLLAGPSRDGKERIGFATNIKTKNFSWTREFYNARWGIETGYRVKKENFLAKTCSQNHTTRHLLFMTAVVLYNTWVVANMAVDSDVIALIETETISSYKPSIEARDFKRANQNTIPEQT